MRGTLSEHYASMSCHATLAPSAGSHDRSHRSLTVLDRSASCMFVIVDRDPSRSCSPAMHRCRAMLCDSVRCAINKQVWSMCGRDVGGRGPRSQNSVLNEKDNITCITHTHHRCQGGGPKYSVASASFLNPEVCQWFVSDHVGSIFDGP